MSQKAPSERHLCSIKGFQAPKAPSERHLEDRYTQIYFRLFYKKFCSKNTQSVSSTIKRSFEGYQDVAPTELFIFDRLLYYKGVAPTELF